ncbi:NAD(P)-binding protein [Panus rudis PR-1116 ss-1]|nr:NAD(P)-binding protein [Panus rudis PR-1116 ss-1]
MSGATAETRKVALITGCSKGGIGFALCEEFAAQGIKVYATARKLEAMEGFAHSSISKLVLDVHSDENAKQVVDTVIAECGHIDFLVNNAGAMCAGPIIDLSIDQIRQAFETNTFSVVRMAKLVIPHMAKRKSGTVINIGSIVADIATPWNGMYSAAKAAVHAITDTLWMECKPFNVNVVLVSPGAVRSNISANQQATFHLPEDTIYKDYIPQIMRRISASQSSSNTMPTDEFARRVVQAVIKKNPPRYMSLGGNSTMFALFKWLPKALVLGYLWRMFSKR